MTHFKNLPESKDLSFCFDNEQIIKRMTALNLGAKSAEMKSCNHDSVLMLPTGETFIYFARKNDNGFACLTPKTATGKIIILLISHAVASNQLDSLDIPINTTLH